MMTTTRNGPSIRAARPADTLRSPALYRAHADRVGALPLRRTARPRRRPTVRRPPPPTRRGVRPLLRLIVSNPGRPRPTKARRRRHLTLVGPRTPVEPYAPGASADPWSDAQPTSHMMIVLALAVAGLVALATSIGRLL